MVVIKTLFVQTTALFATLFHKQHCNHLCDQLFFFATRALEFLLDSVSFKSTLIWLKKLFSVV